MGEKLKDNWVNAIVSAGVALVTVILSTSLTNNKIDEVTMKADIDSKATKVELKELERKNEIEHQKFVQKDQFELMLSILNTIQEQQKETRQDIKELLKSDK